MKAWTCAGLLALLGVLLAAPAAAPAKPRHYTLPAGHSALPAVATASQRPGWFEQARSLHLSFTAKASNGYAISLETRGHRGVILRLSRDGVSASYQTKGRVNRKGVEADFGELGKVAVEFRGRPTRFGLLAELPFALPPGILPHRECRGPRPRQEAGSFRGTILFEGENGFARFDRDNVRGKVQRTYRRLCKGRPPGGLLRTRFRRASARASASASAAGKPKLGNLSMNILVVGGVQAGRKLAFATFGFSGHSGDRLLDALAAIFGPLALATTSERRDGVLIERLGVSLGEEGSLIVSPPKRKAITATVAFPKPFEGTAEYQQAPGLPPSWVGSLIARLPGAGAVPLTGAGLTTVFCRLSLADDDAEENPCVKEAEAIIEDASGDARLLAG